MREAEKSMQHRERGTETRKGKGWTCRDVSGWMEEIAPASLAESWDHTGWMVGDPDRPVTGILVCLDATLARIQEASRLGFNLIVSHHPPLFTSLQDATSDTPEGRFVGAAWQEGIQVFSAHTNFDSAPGGLTDILAEQLQLRDVVPFPGKGEGTVATRARLGTLPEPCDAEAFLAHLRSRLSCRSVRTLGSDPERISRVLVQNGSYDEELLPFLSGSPADVFVTGDVKYHDALDLARTGLFVVDAGHFPTEHGFVAALAARLSDSFPGLPVRMAGESDVYRMR